MDKLMIFEGNTVEVFEWNGLVLFNPYDVGNCLDLSESAVRMAVLKMNKNQVIKLTNSDVNIIDFRKLNNAGENFLTESGVYKLIFKSKKPEAEKFQDWVTDEVLPTIRKTGTYKSQSTVPFREQVECIDIIAKSLRVNDASKILMYDTLYKTYNLPANFLPKYEFNGNRELKSATELLKETKSTMSVIQFNKLMIQNGYLEEKTRISSKGKIKKFKALTEKGLKYGENGLTSYNQKEVQPNYYSDTFAELVDCVKPLVFS